MGRITKILHYEGSNQTPISTETNQYDPVTGKVAYNQDSLGHWTHTQYDVVGNPTSITRAYSYGSQYICSGSPCNQTWTYAYTLINGIERLTEITGPSGYSHTKMEYYTTTDSPPEGGIAGKLHYLKRVNDDASEDILATYTYATDTLGPAYGQVKHITNGAGAVTGYDYDSSGALETVHLPDSNLSNLAVGYTPDAFYQVAQVTDQAGAVTALLYDGVGRTQQVQPPDPATGQASAAYATAYGYDAVDSSGTYSSDPLVKSTVTDPNGRVTERYSDVEGKVIAVKDAAGHATLYTYYPGGFLHTISDANGNLTTYTYDAMDRLATVTDPYGKGTAYAYYADGKLHTRTDAKSQVITYAYDNLGRVTSKTYGSLGSVTFTYAGDRISTVTDTYHPQINGQTQTYTYGYDTRHRLTSVASRTGAVATTYVSATSDQILTVSDGTRTWTYLYYPDGSLHTITAPEGTYTYSYDGVGQVAAVAYPNGSNVQNAYDLQHRLTEIQNLASGGALLSQYDYAYDGGTANKGMITSVTERFRSTDQVLYGPFTTAYGYDSLYQLTQAIYPAYDAGLDIPWSNQTHTWSYDAIGNRTTYTKAGAGTPDVATYAYNLSGLGPQLASITHTDGEPAVTLSYDANGNTATRLENGVTTTYAWDMDDKMTGFTAGSLSRAFTYAYNGDRLQAATGGGATVSYLYSKEDILRTTGGPGGTLYLTQGPGIDDVLAETQGSATAYAYKTMLSSVTGLTDASGTVTKAYPYYAWGNPASWPDLASEPNPYGYTGREWEYGGLNYYRNRFYRPDLGRFLSKDPLIHALGLGIDPIAPSLAGLRTYAYSGNEPVDRTDPMGLQSRPFTSRCPDCTTASPLPSNSPECDNYGDETYLGVSLKCFCKCAGNSPWSQQVRGCLACEHRQGAPTLLAHLACYAVAGLGAAPWPLIYHCLNECARVGV